MTFGSSSLSRMYSTKLEKSNRLNGKQLFMTYLSPIRASYLSRYLNYTNLNDKGRYLLVEMPEFHPATPILKGGRICKSLITAPLYATMSEMFYI